MKIANLFPLAIGQDTINLDETERILLVNEIKKMRARELDVNKSSSEAVIVDIIMQPCETALLKKAKNLGRSIHYGKYMIESQIDLAGNFLDLW